MVQLLVFFLKLMIPQNLYEQISYLVNTVLYINKLFQYHYHQREPYVFCIVYRT